MAAVILFRAVAIAPAATDLRAQQPDHFRRAFDLSSCDLSTTGRSPYMSLEGAIWRGFGPGDMVLQYAVLLGVGAATFAVGVGLLARREM